MLSSSPTVSPWVYYQNKNHDWSEVKKSDMDKFVDDIESTQHTFVKL